MIVVTHQRDKCIGCNYCVEIDSYRWRMSKGDGKAVLNEGVNKRGFSTAKVPDAELDTLEESADVCPMNIIQVKQL